MHTNVTFETNRSMKLWHVFQNSRWQQISFRLQGCTVLMVSRYYHGKNWNKK